MERAFVVLASIFMFIGVGAGAFGAHGLRGHFEKFPALAPTYETAVRYHLIHGLALLAVAWAAGRWPGGLVNWAGYLFAAGIVVFSGSLYALSLTGLCWLGAITPLGGLAFLGGWLLLLVAAWRS
ncbi:MAG: DUF423 domain-containing protein [Chloroflexi bacterium]|nr:DUF423 domain-containing protein [Chloroflexota bacterium]MCI0576055.1 DUF423 domain-containing protein [Chloroflexota bacterium]MCI0647843.1 DUF423 domain-containing protein [Chloroflexota bacterium]MCI0727094.1 DUF423 domain-containing protein [Chloroflexota bacterium]